MKEEYIKYAKRLDTIGDLIISISNLIKTPEEVKILSLEDIRVNKNDLNETIRRFEYAKESLKEVKVPFIVQSQHKKMVQRFEEYIESIRILNNSVNISANNEIQIYESEYNKGLELQKKSVEELEKLTQLIGDKLLK
ncbi:hypothetical protein [Pallidibacillus thermolactis]|uniref:hypothetical protein n=1 Tax=Pallidibacillus thermolactis TaxID=251051 RepID=UPI0021D98663|nr:hypothetical protein [Pallidibacillus thermolactis]MCU9601778.1 hypothetical protein [Pallidibacillus thermolactis subsp. kokeshiiformis]